MSVFTVLEKLAPHVEREVNLILNSKQEAETLKYKLKKIQDELQDAERKSVSDINVKRWLEELEDVMYQMDDALDKWETKNLEQQIEQSEYDDISDPWKKVRSLLLSLCLSFKHVVGRCGLTREMKALSARLDKILEEKGKYNFVSNNSDNSRGLKKPETTSPVDESKVYGRESDKDSLVEFLLSKDKQSSFAIVSIVGVGGLGKTTLAQLVYKDPRVKDHFGDLKAWVSNRDPFDASQAAKAILGALGKSSSGDTTLENLGQQIKSVVSKKNFLLVLDDVWTVDRTKWESLKSFLVDEPGCRILVTTRYETTARTMGTTRWWPLNFLSDSDCEKILNMIALDGRSSEEQHEEFHDIGFEIAEKCNGLPLAAKTIGHMLESKFTVQDWKDVRESPLWRYGDEMSGTFGSLRLSYMDLSPILKLCFMSCVLYSKSSLLHVDEMIRLWMAQGYIGSSATWDEVQSKGRQYLEELFKRSFFHKMTRDEGNMTCQMHDVVHEFANYLARSKHYFILDHRTHDIPIESIGRTRHFYARSVSLEGLPPYFLRLLKCVRVLCLINCGLKVLPQVVGELIHLRYLDLSRNPIKELPETMCNLYNLQTLDLRGCDPLSRLPHGIGKLMNLRYLLISQTNNLREFYEGLAKLTNLWTLNEFRATRDSVEYLRNLNQLRGSLQILVEGLNEAAEAEKANLINKNHIKELELVFYEDVTNMDVIKAMVPPPQVQTLRIWGVGKKQLPSWITTLTSLNNLKTLRILGFDECSDLPPALGKLPMLETLELWEMKFKCLSPEFLGIPRGTSTAVAVGGFPKLKTLVFNDCSSWENWEDLEEECLPLPIMPCLQKLKIVRCPKLKALPHRLLRQATSLQDLATDMKSELLAIRYVYESGASRDMISHSTPEISLLAVGEAAIASASCAIM